MLVIVNTFLIEISDKLLLLIIFFAAEDGEVLYSQHNPDLELWLRSWTPYCAIQTSIEESRENSGLKKAGKTTRSAKYNLIQIPWECSEGDE